MKRLAYRVLRRWRAASNVTPLRGPSIAIGGRHYALSDEGGPLTSPKEWLGGARLVVGPSSGGFKYLWVYDTEDETIAMWRASDGNQKVLGSPGSQRHLMGELDRKRHLNRVTHAEFQRIEREMRDREDDLMRSMKQTIKDNETVVQKQINELVQKYFDRMVRPGVERSLEDLRRGVTPLGFRPHSPNNLERQKAVFVISRALDREFSQSKVEAYLRREGIDLDAPDMDIQAVEWAMGDVREAALDELVPPRE